MCISLASKSRDESAAFGVCRGGNVAIASRSAPRSIGLYCRFHEVGVASEYMVLPPVNPNVSERAHHSRSVMNGECITGTPRGAPSGGSENYTDNG